MEGAYRHGGMENRVLLSEGDRALSLIDRLFK
jgi:hypothetical protein